MKTFPQPSLFFFVGFVCVAASFCRGGDTSDAPPRKIPFAGLTELCHLKTGDPLVDWKSRRVWTSHDGRTLDAKILAVRDGRVILDIGDGRTVALTPDRFSEADQQFIREWEAVSVFFDPGYEASRRLRPTLEPGLFEGAFVQRGKVHETRHFRFECDAVLAEEVVRDFSRLFEVTYLGVLANPLGLAIATPEGGKFQVKLFSQEADYLEAGGSTDAAGVYLMKERVMLVPLASLGLTEGSAGYKKTRDFDPRILIHETAHALTHQWLDHAPMWFIEGFAEYIAAIPYREGRLELARHREGLLALATKKFGGNPTRFPLADPAEFTAMSYGAFMGRKEKRERPIQLPRVEPFQIALLSPGESAEKEPTSSSDALAEVPVIVSEQIEPVVRGGGKRAVPGGPGREGAGEADGSDSGEAVVRRYISSMALVHHLLSSGQTAALRRYLFDLVRYEWERDRYLTRFAEVHHSHRAAVEEQIREFDADLEAFNDAVEAYNLAAIRYHRHEVGTAPPPPAEPEIPAPLPVPDILATPRSAEALSRRAFLEQARERHLRFGDSLSVEAFR
ncbi:MAG: M1 family metallopeptidase [Verrucomicrobiaceae bacterium]|nr:M1 family metallopeptidase [Verrucomicrobiaceae bacterium]